ncbi:MAG: aquaporin, partial [bacterium]
TGRSSDSELRRYLLLVRHSFLAQQYVPAGIAIGATVLLEAMFAEPISGASMNPAGRLGPAIVSGNIQPIRIYKLAPIIGALGASLTWKLMNKKKPRKFG